MVDYEALRQFVAFSECGTLSQVADDFHVSQPTITRNMKLLEESFGVKLFTRTKNHIELNENGMFAAREASLVLKTTNNMIANVRAVDKASHTISIGSCIALPIPEIIGQITSLYPNYSISSEMKKPDQLMKGLEVDEYQLIILPYEPDSKRFKYKTIGEERLYFCLPITHRLSKRDSLSMADMDGENLLLFQEIGFWRDIVDAKMPHSKFLVQTERYSFEELIANTVLPCFSTNMTLQNENNLSPNLNRVNIPITDPEVDVTYYLTCKKENKERFLALFR